MSADPYEEDKLDRGGRRKRQGDESSNSHWDIKRYATQQARFEPGSCWFCLSNIGAEKHLIISVGDFCYAAMPKGPLTEDHVLVMPVGEDCGHYRVGQILGWLKNLE